MPLMVGFSTTGDLPWSFLHIRCDEERDVTALMTTKAEDANNYRVRKLQLALTTIDEVTTTSIQKKAYRKITWLITTSRG